MAESKHKTPLLGWHPTSAERSAWVRSEAQRRGMKLSAILDEMLTEYWERRTTGNHESANHHETASDPPASGNHAGGAAPKARRPRKPQTGASLASSSAPLGTSPATDVTMAPAVAGTVARAFSALPRGDSGRRDCPHPKARVLKGLCGACGAYVGTR